MAKRYKVLALHGLADDPSSFAIKARKLFDELDTLGIDISLPQAPFKMLPPDNFDFSECERHLDGEDWPYYGWMVPDHEEQRLIHLEESLEFIARILEEQGPFVGMIGFSAGAALVANITKILEEGSQQTLFRKINHPPVKFFVSISGLRWPFKHYDSLYPIETPSLHMIGTADVIVPHEHQARLAKSCKDSQVVYHPGGINADNG